MKISSIQNIGLNNSMRSGALCINTSVNNENSMQKSLFNKVNRDYFISFGTRGKLYTKTDPAIKSIETVKSRGGVVPTRVENLAREYAKDETLSKLTLAEVHKIAYADLKKCKTLDEAKELFPEFKCVKSTDEVSVHKGSLLYGIQQGHVMVDSCGEETDDDALKFLQHYWADLYSVMRLAKFMHNIEGSGCCYRIWDPASVFNNLEIPPLNYEYAQAAKFEKGHNQRG